MAVLTMLFALTAAVCSGALAVLALRARPGREEPAPARLPEVRETEEESRIQEGIANLLAYQAGGGRKEER